MRLCVFAVGCLVIASCNYNYEHGGKGRVENVSNEKFANPDFKTIRESILGPKCLGCHSNASGNKGELNLETYKNVRASLRQVAYRSLDSQDMPPEKPLWPRELQLLQNWLDSGAKEEVPAGDEPPDRKLEVGPTNWAKVRVQIFEKKCVACHSEINPDGNLNLTSLAVVRLRAAAIFDRLVVRQDMPLAPYPAMTPREIRVLNKWFETGMPE